MRITLLILLLVTCCAAQVPNELVSSASSAPATTTAMWSYGGTTGEVVKTKLYIDWSRPLTVTESNFLATVPGGCDSSGQSYRGLIEACFRAGIAHAESAPKYGWKDGSGEVYNYAHFCRLFQPADAAHTVQLPPSPPPFKLPPFETAGLAPKVEPLKLIPVTSPCGNITGVEPIRLPLLKLDEVGNIELDPVTKPCGNITTIEPIRLPLLKLEEAEPALLYGLKNFTTGFSRPQPYWRPEPVCELPSKRPVARKIEAGAIRFDRPGYRFMDTIGGAWVSRARSSVSRRVPSEDCGPGQPGPEPPPSGGEPGDPSGPIPCPPDADLNRPPNQPDHGIGGQPWDPLPSDPNVADPVIPGR